MFSDAILAYVGRRSFSPYFRFLPQKLLLGALTTGSKPTAGWVWFHSPNPKKFKDMNAVSATSLVSCRGQVVGANVIRLPWPGSGLDRLSSLLL
jgi:hypothetical protein